MITLANLLKRWSRHHEPSSVPAALLRDIGLSKVLIEFT
jgi:hypothetical protein